MQFMWVSGPTGTVRSISITARKVIMATAGLSVALMLVGFVMYFVGFRIAVEFSPDLARSMGGVTTEAVAWHGQAQSALVTLPPLSAVWFSQVI